MLFANNRSAIAAVSLLAALGAAAFWLSKSSWQPGQPGAANELLASVRPSSMREIAIAPAEQPVRLAAVARYLKASAYVSITRRSMQLAFENLREQTHEDLVTPEIKRLFTADTAALEMAIAPVLASRLTLAQARAIADFYESAAGRFVVAQSLAPDAPVAEKQAAGHEASIKAFFESEAGGSLFAIVNDPALVQAMLHAAQTARREAAVSGAG